VPNARTAANRQIAASAVQLRSSNVRTCAPFPDLDYLRRYFFTQAFFFVPFR
jgi:hypothetical protein